MIPAPSGGYTSRCRTCGREIASEAASCPYCGAANLEERCPNCGAVTTASPDKELRWRCDLCGGPRLPRPDPEVRRARREGPHLKRANEARKKRAKARALAGAGVAVGFAGSAFLGLFALLFGVGFGLAVTWALFAGSALFVVLWALRRAGNATKEMKAAVDQAWVTAASEVAGRMKGAFSAQKLAKALGIDAAQAEELLALLEANDVVRSDVTDAGELAYQAKLRVGDVDLTSPEAEAEALAEAEAMAVEQRAKAGK